MQTGLLILLILTCFVLIFFQNKKIIELNKRIDNIPPPMPNISISAEQAADPFAAPSANRRGIIKETITETLEDKSKKNHYVIIEVEELEQLGDKSRIKILKITGSSERVRKYSETHCPEIVESSKIEFFPE